MAEKKNCSFVPKYMETHTHTYTIVHGIVFHLFHPEKNPYRDTPRLYVSISRYIENCKENTVHGDVAADVWSQILFSLPSLGADTIRFNSTKWLGLSR